MMFFLTSFMLNLKRLFRPQAVFIILLMAFSLMIGGYVERELSLRFSVGVLIDDSELFREIMDYLESISNIDIIYYEDLEKLKEDVASVKIEAGYVFDEDMLKYIESGSINRVARLYKSTSTMADGFTNEMMFAAILRAASPYIAAGYIGGGDYREYGELLEDAKTDIKDYYDRGIFLNIDTVYVGEERIIEQENRITNGVLSVFLFIVFLSVASSGINERNLGVCQKLSNKQTLLYCGAFVMAKAVLFFCAAFVLAFLFAGAENSPISAAFVLLVYISVLSVLCLLLILCFKTPAPILTFFPIICVIVIVFGGAFFNVADVIPAAGAITRIFPTYYFAVYMP